MARMVRTALQVVCQLVNISPLGFKFQIADGGGRLLPLGEKSGMQGTDIFFEREKAFCAGALCAAYVGKTVGDPRHHLVIKVAGQCRPVEFQPVDQLGIKEPFRRSEHIGLQIVDDLPVVVCLFPHDALSGFVLCVSAQVHEHLFGPFCQHRNHVLITSLADVQ